MSDNLQKTMEKEKFHVEYVFDKVSKTSLWNYISAPTGLAEWFADNVSVNGSIYTFTWSKYSNEAEVIGVNANNYIRFRWLDDEDPLAYFEFRLHKVELTGETTLEIIDFAENEEKEDTKFLWESQIKVLKRILGV